MLCSQFQAHNSNVLFSSFRSSNESFFLLFWWINCRLRNTRIFFSDLHITFIVKAYALCSYFMLLHWLPRHQPTFQIAHHKTDTRRTDLTESNKRKKGQQHHYFSSRTVSLSRWSFTQQSDAVNFIVHTLLSSECCIQSSNIPNP